jgi:predicted RNase H-like HicB family nuclease
LVLKFLINLNNIAMTEVFFVVEEALEGGFIAKALGESIFTEAETIEELRVNVKEAVECHFNAEDMPKLIRLHLIKEELIAV